MLTRRQRALLWGFALLAGAALRLPYLLAETPHDDEWHPLLAVKRQRAEKLLTSFGTADRSIPVTLYFEALTQTIGLSDLPMRLPFALAGLAILAALPLAARSREQPALTAPTFALALALSPFLVYYSRTIRPYGIAVLLGFLAVLVLTRALQPEASRSVRAAAIALAVLVGWLLPVHLPFAVAPLLVATGARLARGGLREARRPVFLGLATAAILLALLAPAYWHDGASLREKMGTSGFSLSGSLEAARLLCGSSSWTLTAIWIALAGWGGALAFRRGDPTLRPLTAAALVELAAVVVARPAQMDAGIVLARYLLPAGVVGWLLACDLLQRAIRDRLAPRFQPAGFVAALGVGVALFATGPLRGWLDGGPDNFASTRLHGDFLSRQTASSRNWPPPPPPAYRALADLPPGSAAVLEAPYSGYTSQPYAYYQRAHRQEVYVGVVADFCARHNTIELPPSGERGFELERLVALGDREAQRRRGIRFVVLHRHSEYSAGGTFLKDDFFDFARCTEAFARLSGVEPRVDDRVAFFDLGPPAPV